MSIPGCLLNARRRACPWRIRLLWLPVFVTANSFSSNQGGFNAGFGTTHRLGGAYGDGQMKLFAEARSTWIATPPIGKANGLGRTEIIPVTFGVRW